jgi:flagellar protein FlaG
MNATGAAIRVEVPEVRQPGAVKESAQAAQQGLKAQALAAAQSAKAGHQEPKLQELAANVEKLNALVQAVRRELRFSVDEGTERLVIRVMDAVTGEEIRQIPPEEILNLMEHLQDSTLMVNEEA